MQISRETGVLLDADVKHTELHANDQNYSPPCAKWNSNLQPSKRVIHTMGYKRVEDSLNKVVEQCKAKQKEATLALERLDRDDKRNHTITLAWKLLMKLTSGVIKLGLRLGDKVKPDQKLVIQVLLQTIHDNSNEWDGMFGCHWGYAFMVLNEITGYRITLISNPHFVDFQIGEYSSPTDTGDLSDLEKPDTSNSGTQGAENGAKRVKTAECGVMTDISTMEDPPPSENLEEVRKHLVFRSSEKLSLTFPATITTKATSSPPSAQDKSVVYVAPLHFQLRNQKTEMVNAAKYVHSLKTHLERFLSQLVFEEDDPDGKAATDSYTHRGLFVKESVPVKPTPVRQQQDADAGTNTTQDGATSTPTPTAGESTLTLTTTSHATSNATSTAASSTETTALSNKTPTTTVVTLIEETPVNTATRKTPNPYQPPPNPTGDSTDNGPGETVKEGDSVEARPMKDPLSDIASSTLVEIVNSVSDAYKGLIHEPFLEYDRIIQTLKNDAALVESFVESKYIEKAEEALDLVHKDKRVTPPVLNGAIQKQIEPVERELADVRKQVRSTKKQTQIQKRKESKKRKKAREKSALGNSSDNSDDVDAVPDTETEQQQKKRKRKKKNVPKNSDSHPEIAPSVTQKKDQKTDKTGNRRKKRGKQAGSETTPNTPSGQKGRKSQGPSRQRKGKK